MDIHRCRFVPYPPSAINAVAFSHSYIPGKKASTPVRLAIGRANGDIEIWNPLNGQWHQESILYGGKDRSIDGLVWVNEPDQVLQDGSVLVGRSRLFSIGYTSTVTEWDLEKRRPKKQASGMHGDIWCLGVQPFEIPGKKGQPAQMAQSGKRLVAGTMDGSLALYSIDDGELRFDRILVRSPSKKTKMVSIAFQNRNIAVVGCSNSAVQVYDMRNGNLLRKMTLGSDLSGGNKEIIVWSVKCLSDGDIVSGDSTGHVCIWDGKTYSQAQRLQGHKQDVLSLAVSADGSTIISGGMDKRTILYRKTTGSISRWGRVWHRRYHSHDVKTMASFEGPGISVIVTGGPDAQPIVLPLRAAGTENHRSLSNLPQNVPLASASRARLVVGWWDREVHIWRLQKPLKEIVDLAEAETAVTKNRKLLARILIKGEANITSAAINNDGSLLLVSTTSDIKAFHLKPRSESRNDELKISKVDIPTEIAQNGATNLKISPDGKWVSVVHEGSKTSLLRLSQDSEDEFRPVVQQKPVKLNRLRRDIPKHVALGGLGPYDRSISQVAFSPDTKMLAVSDIAGYIDTWLLQDPTQIAERAQEGDVSEEDSDSEDDGETDPAAARWVRNPNSALVPKLRCALTVLSFSEHVPTDRTVSINGDADAIDDYVLLAINARSDVLTLHPRIGCITPWSKRNPVARFPVEFRNIRDLVKGVLWAGDRAWLYGNTFLVMIDLSKDIAEEITNPSSALVPLEGVPSRPKKRKRGGDTGAGNKMAKGAIGPTKVERHADGEVQELDLDAADAMDTDATSAPDDDSDSDDSEEELQGELVSRRRAEGRKGPDAPPSQGTGFWHTLKYRPIFGIVPLESVEEGSSTDDVVKPYANGQVRKTLEVALVERPMFETDMPDRYFAEGEHERQPSLAWAECTLQRDAEPSTGRRFLVAHISHGFIQSFDFGSKDLNCLVIDTILNMDPVTIITTAASVVGTAIKISKSLYDTVEALKDAPSDVRALCATVESVKSAVSRLVVLMDDADKYAWPDCWLEDVSVDIDAISAVLSDVERLLADWEDSRGPGADKKSGSAVRDAWRNWKWHLNAEEIQRCTKKLRDARDDLGLQLSTIQISTTAQTSQDVIEVKDMLGSIEAKLVKNVAVYDQRAFNAELSAFGEQIESLRLAVLGLNGQAKQPTAEQELQRSQDVDKKDVYAFSSQRSSLDSTQSGSSSPILSPLAALNSHAFAQNQNITASYKSSKESPMSIAVLGLQLSAMKQKHDELLIHWNNAEDHIAYLKDEIDSLSGGPVSRTEQNTVSDEQSENPLESNIREDEIDSREAVIGVLQAQNEALQDMVSGRVTVVGYKDKSESDARKLSRKIIKKNETILQQQEEIDLLAWRLQGEQSALREQLKVNKILGAHVKRQQEADGHRRTRLLTPSPQPSERVSNEGSSDRHGFRPWTPASDATRPSSSSSIVSKVSFLKKPPSPWQGSSVPAVPAGQK